MFGLFRFLSCILIPVIFYQGVAFGKSRLGLVKIEEADGSPSVITGKIIMPNGSLTDNTGSVTVDPAKISNTQTESLGDDATLTPDAGSLVFISVTGTASPTNLVFAKSGSETHDDRAVIFNAGTTNIGLTTIAGTLQLSGDTLIQPGGSLHLVFKTDRWFGDGGYKITQYASGINMSPLGVVQGATKMFTAATDKELENTELNSMTVFTATGDLIIKAGNCNTNTGVTVCAMKTTTDTTEIYSLDGSDGYRLADWTDTGGDAVRLAAAAGSFTCLRCIQPNVWLAIDFQGTSTDSGGAGASCTLYDYFTGTVDSGTAVGGYTNYVYAGTIITPDSTITVCEFTVNIRSITGDVSSTGSHKDFYLQIYDLSSGDFDGAALATSDVLDGDDVVTGDYKFTFGTPQSLTLATAYGFAVKMCADGSTTAEVDTSNFISLGFDNENNAGDMVGGLVATDGRCRWNSSGTRNTYDPEDDLKVEIYTQ
jgi:hypothetical protein